MGGIGSGGARPNSGPTKKSDRAKWLGGNASKQAVKPGKPAQPSATPLLSAPKWLNEREHELWNELAPLACSQRTLTEQTARSFADLCRAIVRRDDMQAQIDRDGLTYLKVTVDGSGQEHNEIKAHPLISQSRGMMQRIEQGMIRFRLSPMGKEIATPEKPNDEWAEFDGGVQ